MFRNSKPTVWSVFLLILLVIFGLGCAEWIAAPMAGSFALGYWLGYEHATGGATQTTTCYRNGEPIDCSLIP